MSLCECETKSCPECGSDIEVSWDYRDFVVSGECYECGFFFNTTQGQSTLEETNEERIGMEMEPLTEFKKKVEVRGKMNILLQSMTNLVVAIEEMVVEGETENYLICSTIAEDHGLFTDDKFPTWLPRVVQGVMRDFSEDIDHDGSR